MELITDQGLRIDGRRPNELRRFKCKIGIYSHTDGSAYVEQGNTKVLATVFGPHEVRSNYKSKMSSNSLLVNCQYSMATFSTSERKKKTRGDRKSSEMTINLQQALNAAIKTELLPRSQLDIYVQVLQADGGNYSTCLNAATLALIDAGIPMREYVVACTATLGNGGVPMLDISHLEETLGGATLTVAILPISKQIAMIEMSQRFHIDYLEEVLNLAIKGCTDIYTLLDLAVREYLIEIGSPNSWGQGL